MSWGDARYQSFHIRRPRDHHFFWGNPLRPYHHYFWEQAEVDVSHKIKDLPVLWVGLGEVWCHKRSDPEHVDVGLWGL